MAVKTRWIRGTSADQRLSAAARRALKVRLRQVCRLLPLAAEKADDDVEYVHQLRVAARRAVATLDFFADLLPRRRAAWLRKQIKRIRRAAGEARDFDVMLARFSPRDGAASGRVLLDYLTQRRQEAQMPLREIQVRLRERRFARKVADLLDRLAWRQQIATEPTFAEAARTRLGWVLEEFIEASQVDLADVEALHQFRIAVKRLRYAMEIVARAMPKAFRVRLYPQIQELQDRLGKLNDHATAKRRFETWSEDLPPGELASVFQQFAVAESESLERERQEFLAWWTPQRARRLHRQFEKQMW
jgi:CHAD domain-containing protein